MLANASSLYRLASDPSFERRFAANLQLQQVSFFHEYLNRFTNTRFTSHDLARQVKRKQNEPRVRKQQKESSTTFPTLTQQKHENSCCFVVADLNRVVSRQDDPEPPFLILIIEDCFIELCDENKLGKDFTFEIKFKTNTPRQCFRTGRSFIFAAEDFKTLERWVSLLTITPIDYMLLSKQSFAEQIERVQSSEEAESTK
ncbi:hypothetical protein NECAME_00944 [Necator americanus]|uniref:PH domain-containing protein n=1 Tax=Necator americanus TaxID=51031 RepID=W2SNP7_NECAM|nr:hypothetical protein NECAME_00944 [Necator americanus]ETN71255.1 hypothetical protein NECAME_00944 [Necator americanus]